MELYNIMKNRRSTRKFLPDEITESQIEELISAAVTAPSGCNSQCWKFIAVKDINKIVELSKSVEKGVRRFYNDAPDENFVCSRIKQTTFFKNAPLVFFVFYTEMKYHDPRVEEYYSSKGFNSDEMLTALGNPEILSIGAAVENLLLKAEDMGLGACWMNDPVVAESEIKAALDVNSNYRLMSVIPVGKSAYKPPKKAMKPMSEVLEII